MRSTWLVVVLALPIAAAPLSAGAQMFTAGGGIAPAMAMNQLMMQPVRESVAQTMARGGGGGGSGRGLAGTRYLQAPAGAVPARATTTYRAEPAVSARVKEQFLDWIGKTAPGDVPRLRAEFQRRDPLDTWMEMSSGDGLQRGDVVDALTGYWVLNWAIANTASPSPARISAVRQQVRRVLAGNPAFLRLNEAQRQEMAEVFMLNYVIQYATFQDAYTRRDQGTIRRLGDAAVARFRSEMGQDLRRMDLTDAGFVRRG